MTPQAAPNGLCRRQRCQHSPLLQAGQRGARTHMLEYHQERETLPNSDLDDGSLVYS